MGSALDAHSVVEEVELVEIHLDNLIFGVVAFEFYGNHPFDRLLHETLQHIFRRRGVELLGELLSDSGATAGIFLKQESALNHGSHETAHIDAGVVEETHILGGDERVGNIGGNLIEIDIDTVAFALIVSPEFLSVARNHHRCKLVGGVFKFLYGRHIANYAIVDESEEEHHAKHNGNECNPEHMDDVPSAILLIVFDSSHEI